MGPRRFLTLMALALAHGACSSSGTEPNQGAFLGNATTHELYQFVIADGWSASRVSALQTLGAMSIRSYMAHLSANTTSATLELDGKVLSNSAVVDADKVAALDQVFSNMGELWAHNGFRINTVPSEAAFSEALAQRLGLAPNLDLVDPLSPMDMPPGSDLEVEAAPYFDSFNESDHLEKQVTSGSVYIRPAWGKMGDYLRAFNKAIANTDIESTYTSIFSAGYNGRAVKQVQSYTCADGTQLTKTAMLSSPGGKPLETSYTAQQGHAKESITLCANGSYLRQSSHVEQGKIADGGGPQTGG